MIKSEESVLPSEGGEGGTIPGAKGLTGLSGLEKKETSLVALGAVVFNAANPRCSALPPTDTEIYSY